jgi:hypothetical protein
MKCRISFIDAFGESNAIEGTFISMDEHWVKCHPTDKSTQVSINTARIVLIVWLTN